MSSIQYTIAIPPPAGVISKTVECYNKKYTVLNIPKNQENAENLKYRSVIVDTDTNTLLSISPVKSIPFEEFIQKYPEHTADIQINEIAEGTMIQLFFDHESRKWNIATKSAVGGNNWYFNNGAEKGTQRPKTFREMFYDALRVVEYTTPLCDIPFVRDLDVSYIYSFVLQHPENHLVFHVPHPVLVLVSMTAIVETKFVGLYGVHFIAQPDFSQVVRHLDTHSGMVNVPLLFSHENVYNNIQLNPNMLFSEKGAEKGVMITNVKTGERTKLENPEYIKRKELRGNHPNLHYNYLALMRTGKVSEFLQYYPMYTDMFRKFYTQYHTLITDVHQAYITYYVHKQCEEHIPKRYFLHASRIHHSIYIPSLATGKKVIIKHNVVRSYFDQMEPREILYFMYL